MLFRIWTTFYRLAVVGAALATGRLKRRRETEASTSGVNGDGERNEGTGEPPSRG